MRTPCAHLYGYYDAQDPENSDELHAADAGEARRAARRSMGVLIGRHVAAPPLARQHIFGYGTRISTTALDLARAGWLWYSQGRWGDVQLVPEAWMRDSTQVAQRYQGALPPNRWLCSPPGKGFWSNSEGMIWLELPRDGFHSWGAGGHYTAVFPSEELVIVQNPDPLGVRGGEGANPELIELVFATCD